jgi:EpsI family protein
LTVVILIGVSAFLTVALNLSATDEGSPANLQAIPLTIGDYTATDLPADDEIKKILETPNVLMRDYVSPGGLQIMLSIVYYEQYRVDFHMPEGCMTGRGSIITDSRTQALFYDSRKSPLLVNSLVLKQRTENEHVLYYFLVNDFITPSYFRMRLRLMTQHLMRKPTSAALVRFSVRLPDGQNEGMDEFRNFVTQMTSLLPSYLAKETS